MPLDTVDTIGLYSYISHPMWTSPGIVITRFDASTGTSVVWTDGGVGGAPVVHRRGGVHLSGAIWRAGGPPGPASRAVTLPRSIDVRNVVFKVGYPAEETNRIRVLLELGFDEDAPFELDGVAISPRRFAAAYIGRRGIGADERSANVKHVRVDGTRDGRPVTAHLRLRRRGDRPLGLVDDHRDRGRDRRGHRRARRRPPRGPPAGGRLRAAAVPRCARRSGA